MTLLDEYLLVYEFRELHATHVRARPARTFRVIKAVTSAELPIMRTLLAIRALPALVGGRRGLRLGGAHPLVESAIQAGFILLGEVPDQELVLGAVGQPWKVGGGGRTMIATAADYQLFSWPGYVKMATNFFLQESADTVILRTETRIHATDVAARRAFGWYWRVIYPGSALIRREWLRAIRRRAEVGGRA